MFLYEVHRRGQLRLLDEVKIFSWALPGLRMRSLWALRTRSIIPLWLLLLWPPNHDFLSLSISVHLLNTPFPVLLYLLAGILNSIFISSIFLIFPVDLLSSTLWGGGLWLLVDPLLVLAVLFDNILLIEGLWVESSEVGTLHLSGWVLRMTVVMFKLESVIIIKLLLAVHAHVRLALLTWAIEAPLIQELVD